MKSLKISLKIYLLLLAIFFFFRLLLLLTNIPALEGASLGEILKAFLIGIRFDTTTICYIISIPAILLLIGEFIGKMPNYLKIIIICFLSVLSSLAFLVSGADIPYYNEFITRFNIAALNNIKPGQTGTVVKMIFEEWKYILFIIPVIILLVLFVLRIRKTINETKSFKKDGYFEKSIGALLLVVMVFFGMRGSLKLGDVPITPNDSFFCSNNFLNQLGLNPTYMLIVSAAEDVDNDYFSNIDEQQGLAEVQRQLGIEQEDSDFPLSRRVAADKEKNNYNVVLVLMESMKSSNMAHFGNTDNLTPVLDSLCNNSLFFNKFYSQNTRTCYGIFSTLMSYPSMYPGNPMYGTPLRKYESMPSVLKENGYSTGAIISHDKQFDNIYGFYMANDFDKIVSEEDYPKKEIINSWGIPDHILFDHSLDLIDELHADGNPFFINILTVSNHPPYVLPEGYQSPHPDYSDTQKEIEYADYSIGYFLEKASEKSWYDSTIFVFLGDHGKVESSPYPISLDFVHVPLIIHAPAIIEPFTDTLVASQLDVFPTVMGFLGIDYNNSTFGLDLTKQKRQYAYFMNGNKYGIIDNEWYYCSDLQGGNAGLYHYTDNDATNYIDVYKEKAAEMKFYGECNWKTTLMLNGNRVEVSRFLR